MCQLVSVMGSKGYSEKAKTRQARHCEGGAMQDRPGQGNRSKRGTRLAGTDKLSASDKDRGSYLRGGDGGGWMDGWMDVRRSNAWLRRRGSAEGVREEQSGPQFAETALAVHSTVKVQHGCLYGETALGSCAPRN